MLVHTLLFQLGSPDAFVSCVVDDSEDLQHVIEDLVVDEIREAINLNATSFDTLNWFTETWERRQSCVQLLKRDEKALAGV